MISTIIIDDEQDCIEDLLYLFKKNELPIQVLATARSGKEGLASILKYKPQLVFLDVIMPGMSGFEMLDLLPKIDFQLIITTSVDTYAIQAIRSSALDFLLKPLKQTELADAVARTIEKVEMPEKSQINLLQELLLEKSKPINKIAVSSTDGIELIRIDDILYFESEGNYTTIYLSNDKKILSTKPIGKYEETFSNTAFFRVHNSYLVNLNFINKFVRSDGGYIVLSNGKTIAVARRKKDEFLELLNKI